MQQFVPLTDELLYSAGGLPAHLVPYRVGMPCGRALPARDEVRQANAQCETVSLSPGFAPSFSATPALSSSTYCAGPVEG